MLSDENRVIVEDALCSRCFVPAKQVHHRDFPEIRAACGSIAEGVIHLAEQLSRYREGAPTGWHRELIDRAIAEVADYLDTLPEARQAGESHCRCGARDLDKLASTPAQARSSQ